MKPLDISVYIPAYNAEQYLEKCLAGVKAQTYPIKEIIVIDDGSTDATAEIARDMGARLMQQPGNSGLSRARRRAFEEIDAEYLAALDSDCVPEPDWLEILANDIQHPYIAGSSGKLIEFYTKNPVDLWRKIHMPQNWGNNRILSPLLVFGNNTLFRRETVLSVGNYPSSDFYRTNNEDYYISRKLYERGYALVYNPSAVVQHHRRDNVSSLFRTYWRWFFLHKPRPDSLKNFWRKGKENIATTRKFMLQDWRRRDFRLVFLSFLCLFYQTDLDIKYFLQAE